MSCVSDQPWLLALKIPLLLYQWLTPLPLLFWPSGIMPQLNLTSKIALTLPFKQFQINYDQMNGHVSVLNKHKITAKKLFS
jgi:hypothetical protein